MYSIDPSLPHSLYPTFDLYKCRKQNRKQNSSMQIPFLFFDAKGLFIRSGGSFADALMLHTVSMLQKVE